MFWHFLIFVCTLSSCAIALTASLFLSVEIVEELRRIRRPRWEMSYLHFSALRVSEEYKALSSEMRLMGASMAAIAATVVLMTACAALLIGGKP